MKLAIITGADGGMGYEETRAVAQAGYRVIMACYCPKKAQPKCEKLKAETGNPDIEVIALDLANLSLVRAFADEVKRRYDHLDLLMNNAGTMEMERTIQVNYVGHYLLTRLLLPLMDRGSRIVSMASLVVPWGRLHFPQFFERGTWFRTWWRFFPYFNSKLAIALFTIDLSRRLEAQGITVNAADPGIVSTEIIRMQMFFDPITDLVFRPFIRTPRQGADTAIHLLLDEDKAGQTGTFNRSNRIAPWKIKRSEQAKMQELWDRTEEIVRPFLE